MRNTLRTNKATILLTCLVILLACGWMSREWLHAQEKQQLLASQTKSLSAVKIEDIVYEGTPRGKVGVYFNQNTAGTRNFVVGKADLRPGMEPHPIHKHPEEEILIVTKGKGEIHCDGKVTKIGPGAIMYTGPNAPHGITNTGDDELTFYFVKWIGVPTRSGQ